MGPVIAPTRVYQNHHLDSTRWDGFVPRPDDIIVSASYKPGTTWTQRIVSLLILGPGPLPPGGLNNVSPWVDARFMEPVEPLSGRLAAQAHRRFAKSHLAFDAIPCCDGGQYTSGGR